MDEILSKDLRRDPFIMGGGNWDRDLKREDQRSKNLGDEIYACTLISPNWRMRGRIAIDAMVLTDADADDNNQKGRYGREERRDGDGGG